jgi:hypothetical protein
MATLLTIKHYYDTIDRLWQAICHHRCGLLDEGVIILHHTDRLRTAKWTCDCLYSATVQMLRTTLPAFATLQPVFSIFGPLKKHLAGKWFVKKLLMWSKLSLPGYTCLTFISCVLGCKPCCYDGISGQMWVVTVYVSHAYHLLHVCLVYIAVWIKFLPSEYLLLYLLKWFAYCMYTVSTSSVQDYA